MKKLLFTTTIFVSTLITIYSQTGSIRGFVYETKTGEPVMFTNVYLKGTTYGSTTDINGYYAITRIPPGNYTLMVTSIGYDTTKVEIRIEANKTVEKNLTLATAVVRLDEIVVSAERQEMKSLVYTSLVKITPKQINLLPSIGGERDIAQFLQVVPGVIFTGDQGGQLYIRGGAPINNKVLLDGMTIYNPFHSIGLFSVFDTDIIKNTDVYTGGFNVEYGGRISSVMDFSTRDGNKKEFTGRFNTNTMASKLLVEGPIKKMKEGEYSAITYLLSIKQSYIEWASQNIYNNLNVDRLPFEFTDIYGKVSINGKTGNKLNVFGFSFNDKVKNFQGLDDFSWNSYGMGASTVIVPSGYSTVINLGVNYSHYKVGMTAADNDGKPRESSIGNFGFNMNFIYQIGDNELKYGIDLNTLSTNFSYTNKYNYLFSIDKGTAELAAYAKYKWVLGNLILDPGVRITNYSSLGETRLEPRMGLKWILTEKLRFKSSGGLYSQNLIAANSDRDLINLFYGFIAAPDDKLTYKNDDIESKLQKSWHLVGGFEYDFTSFLTGNVETYYKRFSQLVNVNRLAIYPDDNIYWDKPKLLKKEMIIETGDAYGLDFLFKYNRNQLYLWIVYSLGFVSREGEFMDLYHNIYTSQYPPHFDRRHNVNFVGAYTFGKKLLWEISGRWNFGSGFPFTPNRGFYEQIFFPDVNTFYPNSQGDVQVIYGVINSKRLPAYHRLDINLKRTVPMKNNCELAIDIGVTNAYNRKNIFYVHRRLNKIIYQMPFMPSMGMSLIF